MLRQYIYTSNDIGSCSNNVSARHSKPLHLYIML